MHAGFGDALLSFILDSSPILVVCNKQCCDRVLLFLPLIIDPTVRRRGNLGKHIGEVLSLSCVSSLCSLSLSLSLSPSSSVTNWFERKVSNKER